MRLTARTRRDQRRRPPSADGGYIRNTGTGRRTRLGVGAGGVRATSASTRERPSMRPLPRASRPRHPVHGIHNKPKASEVVNPRDGRRVGRFRVSGDGGEAAERQQHIDEQGFARGGDFAYAGELDRLATAAERNAAAEAQYALQAGESNVEIVEFNAGQAAKAILRDANNSLAALRASGSSEMAQRLSMRDIGEDVIAQNAKKQYEADSAKHSAEVTANRALYAGQMSARQYRVRAAQIREAWEGPERLVSTREKAAHKRKYETAMANIDNAIKTMNNTPVRSVSGVAYNAARLRQLQARKKALQAGYEESKKRR